MKDSFDFNLKQIRSEVDDEEIGFRLSGDKAKPVHFATGFFRGILGERADTELLSRMVYVVNAKGQIQRGCEISEIMEELRGQAIIEKEIEQDDVQALRVMMQSLLSADSAVFGEKGSSVSYSAASAQFITSKARYEEVGEIGAGIIKEACPELSEFVKKLLCDQSDEISLLFSPIKCNMIPVDEDVGKLPKWTNKQKKNTAWQEYIASVQRSGKCLQENIDGLPKLLAIRTVVQFAIFHLIRYLSKQEFFHDSGSPSVLPFLAVYADIRRSSLVDSSKSSVFQIGQSLARFYASSYAKKFEDYDLSFRDLMRLDQAPLYDEKKKQTRSDKKKAEQNNEVWRSAKNVAKDESDKGKGLWQLGYAIHNMVATASDTNPDKYIRGLGLRTGILYPATPRVKPYFRFSQDITGMLIISTVHKNENLAGDEFLLRLRKNFDVVTGGLESDYDFCSEHLRMMRIDEDELSMNGEAFIAQICDMGYGQILADGIFRVSMGE